jgi:outer membrane protein assembly factor BamD
VRAVVLGCILGLFFLSGCAGSRSAQRLDTPEEAYNRALALFERGRYAQAAEMAQRVFEFGRGHEYAEPAQLLLARSYFQARDYLMAANEYNRYITLYPRSERVEEAEFERALCYYYLSPPYYLDQSDTQRAIDLLRLFTIRYPGSPRAAEAARYITELRNRLARKIYEAARLYMRMEAWEAAALTFGEVLNQYPDSEWADRALLGQVQAYMAFASSSVPARQAERYRMALEAANRFRQLFPQSPLRPQLEALAVEIQSRLGDGQAIR